MHHVLSVVVLILSLSFCFLPSASAQPKPVAKLLKPVNLALLNTAADEEDPYISRDGKRLFYASKASGHFQLFVSEQRRPLAFFPGSERWPAGKELEGPNAETDSRSPFLTADNHDLYYAEKTTVRIPTGPESPENLNFEIVHSIRSDAQNPRQFTGPTFVQSVCTPADELQPWLTEDGLEMFFSRKTKEGWQVFVASRPPAAKGQPKGAFGEPKLVKELPVGFHHATLTRDRQTMYLQGPLENNRWGLFRSRRAGVKLPWGKPQLLEGLSHPQAATGDMSPCLSRDASKLYFSSDRPGGKGGRDLWVIETSWFTK